MKLLGKILTYTFFLSLCVSEVFASSEAHGEAGVPFKIVYAVINFFILFGILFYLLRKPTQDFFASRSKLIQKVLDEAKELKEDAEQKFQTYESKLKGVELEMQKLIGDLKIDGELEKKRMIELATHQIQILKQNAQKMMIQEVSRAKEELKREAVYLATELAEQLVRENINSADQNRIVSEYLDRMEKLA